VDLTRANAGEGEQSRNSECRAGKKDDLVREQVAKQPHEACGTKTADCRKPLVSPETVGKTFVSDQTEADRHNGRPKEPASDTKEHLGDHCRRETWPKRQYQCGAGDRYNRERDHEPF
jgi:hypothetical protein